MARRDQHQDSPINLNVRGMGVSATIAINERSAQLQREGREVARLGLGQSPFPVPPPVVEALRAHAGEKDYLPPRGLLALREAIAAHQERLSGVAWDPAHVVVGPGSKELMFVLQLVYYGDILIPTPAWVSYAPQARIIGRNVQLIHTRAEDGWKLRPEQLEEICAADPSRPRILILNYPSNPHGGSYRPGELKALAAAARRYGVVVLSDEIYGRLHHDGSYRTISRYYPTGTIVSTGLSKWCGAGGWRLGVFLLPAGMKRLVEAMASVASETFTSTSAPIQHAAITAFQPDAGIELYLRDSQRLLRSLGQWLHGTLERAGLEVSAPEGGFYLFPGFAPYREALAARGIGGSRALCEALLEELGVATLPGRDFGREDGELRVRIATVDFDGGAALEALAAMPPEFVPGTPFLREHCGRTVGAVERIAGWVEGLSPAP